MKQDREDIDWAKLKLIVSKFKKDFGLSEEGMLDWTGEIAQNFVTELKLKLRQDNNPVSSDILDNEGDSSNEKQNEKVEEVSDTKVGQPEKRKMPGWMFSSNTDMAVKKRKKF